jgi:GT2 family glycosyltransferase
VVSGAQALQKIAMITVVIPNWNRAALLETALDSLRRQTRPAEEIIVVDNGSTDNSVQVAHAAGARVIEMHANAGFARAVNTGIQAATGDFIAVVNNDVHLEPAWLQTLWASLAPSEYGFATGKLLDASRDGVIDGTWDEICRGGCAWRCGQGRADAEVWNRGRPIRFAPFTAVLFRASVFQRVGMLDHTYESYMEDVDFGIRCAMNGVEGLYVPEARCRHRGSATYGQWSYDTVRLLARNQAVLIARNFPDSWLIRYGWPVMVAQVLWGVLAARHGQFRAWARGKMEGARLFRALRRNRPAHDARTFHRIILEAEDEIKALQKATGYDLFWRLYFALT